MLPMNAKYLNVIHTLYSCEIQFLFDLLNELERIKLYFEYFGLNFRPSSDT